MTAIEVYYQCLSEGKLPATVPIPGDGGLGTVSFDLKIRPAVFAAAHDVDPQDRAVIAIYACQAAHEAVESTISK